MNALKWKYYEFLSEQQKKNVVKFVKKEIENNFDYDSFLFLLNYNIKVSPSVIESLRVYLDSQIESVKESIPFKTSLARKPLEHLNHTGYLCLAGYLDKALFEKYQNISPLFDFYYQYEKFNFSNFNIVWLLQMTKHMHLNISKNSYVCKQLRNIISNELKSESLKGDDRKKFVDILTNYYCD